MLQIVPTYYAGALHAELPARASTPPRRRATTPPRRRATAPPSAGGGRQPPTRTHRCEASTRCVCIYIYSCYTLRLGMSLETRVCTVFTGRMCVLYSRCVLCVECKPSGRIQQIGCWDQRWEGQAERIKVQGHKGWVRVVWDPSRL